MGPKGMNSFNHYAYGCVCQWLWETAAGTIKSAWKYEGDICTWTFTIPEGTSASVTLPGENETRTYAPGSYTLIW